MKFFIASVNSRFYGNESVTYTTHSDPTFILANLIPLAERWQGPISLVIYAPGTDYDLALKAIAHLRTCRPKSYLVRDLVTFHIFSEIKFSSEYKKLPRANCNWNLVEDNAETFRKAHNLTYPINVARNVARESATTHFVLPSDIELYPNPGLISGFLRMLSDGNEDVINRRYETDRQTRQCRTIVQSKEKVAVSCIHAL